MVPAAYYIGGGEKEREEGSTIRLCCFIDFAQRKRKGRRKNERKYIRKKREFVICIDDRETKEKKGNRRSDALSFSHTKAYIVL